MDREQQLPQLEYSSDKGMLFVRITYILSIMIRAPIIAACFVLIALTSLIQYSSGALKVLDFTIYTDGTTHVFYKTEVDPLAPDSTIKLFGNNIDNFVAQDEKGLLLESKIDGNSAVIQTLGASEIQLDYDTADLVTKNGKVWSFHADAPIEYSVLLPKNTVIVGMSTYPLNMQIVDEQSRISLSSGAADISYVFGVLGTAQTATLAIEKTRDLINKINAEEIKTPMASAKLQQAISAFNESKFSSAEILANEARNIAAQEQQTALSKPKPSLDNNIVLVGTAVAGGAAAAIILAKLGKSRKLLSAQTLSKDEKYVAPDKETIFRLKPDLRQEDKDIVVFISESGGEVYESDLRKKFLLPRTTTWRAVKRLEREGIVEIYKKDQQNRIRLRNISGENSI